MAATNLLLLSACGGSGEVLVRSDRPSVTKTKKTLRVHLEAPRPVPVELPRAEIFKPAKIVTYDSARSGPTFDIVGYTLTSSSLTVFGHSRDFVVPVPPANERVAAEVVSGDSITHYVEEIAEKAAVIDTVQSRSRRGMTWRRYFMVLGGGAVVVLLIIVAMRR